MQYVEMLVEYFMDSLEEFVDAVKFPTASYTYNAFLVSLIFTITSLATELLGIFTLIQWKEAVTCNILLLVVTLIDSSTRASTMGFVKDLSTKALDRVQATNAKMTTVMSSRNRGRGFENEEDYVELEYEEYDEYGDYEVEEEDYYNE